MLEPKKLHEKYCNKHHQHGEARRGTQLRMTSHPELWAGWYQEFIKGFLEYHKQKSKNKQAPKQVTSCLTRCVLNHPEKIHAQVYSSTTTTRTSLSVTAQSRSSKVRETLKHSNSEFSEMFNASTACGTCSQETCVANAGEAFTRKFTNPEVKSQVTRLSKVRDELLPSSSFFGEEEESQTRSSRWPL